MIWFGLAVAAVSFLAARLGSGTPPENQMPYWLLVGGAFGLAWFIWGCVDRRTQEGRLIDAAREMWKYVRDAYAALPASPDFPTVDDALSKAPTSPNQHPRGEGAAEAKQRLVQLVQAIYPPDPADSILATTETHNGPRDLFDRFRADAKTVFREWGNGFCLWSLPRLWFLRRSLSDGHRQTFRILWYCEEPLLVQRGKDERRKGLRWAERIASAIWGPRRLRFWRD